MKVEYIHEQPGIANGNILWSPSYPMRHGKFPKDHPCTTSHDTGPRDENCSASNIEKFRARGYWASCFPEGDGITLKSPRKTCDQVVKDIEECFGWEVTVKGKA